MATNIKPTPIALVVCDNIYHEQTGKPALVGLFNGINADRFPARHPRMAVFVSLTGLREGSIAKLEIVNAETEHVVVSAQTPFPEGATPVVIADMQFIFNNVIFPEPGQYFIRFWTNDHLLMMRPFHVKQSRGKGAASE